MRARTGAVRKPALTAPVFGPTRELWPLAKPQPLALNALTGIEVVDTINSAREVRSQIRHGQAVVMPQYRIASGRSEFSRTGEDRDRGEYTPNRAQES